MVQVIKGSFIQSINHTATWISVKKQPKIEKLIVTENLHKDLKNMAAADNQIYTRLYISKLLYFISKNVSQRRVMFIDESRREYKSYKMPALTG